MKKNKKSVEKIKKKDKPIVRKKSEALEFHNLVILVIMLILFVAVVLIYGFSPVIKERKVMTNSSNISNSPVNEMRKAQITLEDISKKGEMTEAIVTRIIDGDTFEIGSGEIVRLICVDAPEKGKPGYEKATQFLKEFILNKKVKLEKDVSEKDKYDRLLRYVYVDITKQSGCSCNPTYTTQEVFINQEIVRKGFAEVYEFEPDTKRCNEIDS